MSLWVDKYRPNSLKKLSLHPELTANLTNIASRQELPHLLFYGPPGAGKKTRVLALLREIFGSSVEKIKLEHRTFKTTSNRTVGNINSPFVHLFHDFPLHIFVAH